MENLEWVILINLYSTRKANKTLTYICWKKYLNFKKDVGDLFYH